MSPGLLKTVNKYFGVHQEDEDLTIKELVDYENPEERKQRLKRLELRRNGNSDLPVRTISYELTALNYQLKQQSA